MLTDSVPPEVKTTSVGCADADRREPFPRVLEERPRGAGRPRGSRRGSRRGRAPSTLASAASGRTGAEAAWSRYALTRPSCPPPLFRRIRRPGPICGPRPPDSPEKRRATGAFAHRYPGPHARDRHRDPARRAPHPPRRAARGVVGERDIPRGLPVRPLGRRLGGRDAPPRARRRRTLDRRIEAPAARRPVHPPRRRSPRGRATCTTPGCTCSTPTHAASSAPRRASGGDTSRTRIHSTGARVPTPRVGLDHTVVYEAHVKGLTKLNPAVPEDLRGTYGGDRARLDDRVPQGPRRHRDRAAPDPSVRLRAAAHQAGPHQLLGLQTRSTSSLRTPRTPPRAAQVGGQPARSSASSRGW